MGGHHNQDYYKVQGSPMRSRDIARLYRKRFTARQAALRQKASYGPPIPEMHPPGEEAARLHPAGEGIAARRAPAATSRPPQRAREREASTFPKRLSWLLPQKLGGRLRTVWRRSRRPLGLAAGAVLAPLTVARLVRRIRGR